MSRRAVPPHWPQSTEIVQKISQIKQEAQASQKPSPRLGRKGFLYLQKTAPKAVKPEERLKITARRMVKAERDERMDVTAALTPVKQYMAGFTRPSDLRSSNWFPGGAYVARGKVYESPVEEAYEPHTVFLLESRYNIRYGPGRVESPEYIYGICREQDLPAVLKTYNSTAVPRGVIEAMDNARWPMGPQLKPKGRQRWWIDHADLEQTLKEIGSGALPPDPDLVEEEDEDEAPSEKPRRKKSALFAALIPPPSLSNPVLQPLGDSSIPSSVRAIHSSSILRVGRVPYEVRREDGTVIHSGFEPSTAADDLAHSGNSRADSHIDQQPLAPGSGAKRGLHTTASVRAAKASVRAAKTPAPAAEEPVSPEAEPEPVEAGWDFERARALSPTAQFVPREQYLSTLETEPFWRPLITLTVSTRPIAFTLLRLAKSQVTGRPFHADIDNHDKKCRISFKYRMRTLRLKRIENLAVQMGQVLAGARGGVIGIRFDTDSFGRGIGGESLANPVPWDKRVIGVGVGNFYRLASDLKEMLRLRAEEDISASRPFEIFDVDEFGNRISLETGEVVPWTPHKETIVDKWKRELWYADYRHLHHALQLFVRYAQVHHVVNTVAKKGPIAAATRSAGIHNIIRPSVLDARPIREEKDDDNFEELELGIDEDTPRIKHDPALGLTIPPVPEPPIVRMRADALEKLKSQQHNRLEDEPEEEPPEFILCSPDGKPLVGPRGEDGKFLLEGTEPVPLLWARIVVQRKFDLFCVTKTKELATIIAVGHAKVDWPNRIRSQ
ncbi:hypothetical protein B0H19DRAFT_1014188 [Mycena capillaripes]|nr:hypothetical protein B0H19DRAFT_1014188 [Mycena capillaripes]